MPLLPETRLGPYEIRSLLGSGGMGEVYLAHDTRLGRDVAVKVLPELASGNRDRLRRFEHEARAAAALNHPGILAVHDVGWHEGSPYIVSELLEGETLRKRLRAGGFTVQKALEVVLPLARALSAAHEKGIVHRDLKPENVFLTREQQVKVLDFGLAKLRREEPGAESPMDTKGMSTASGIVLGTASYMSPEQVRGQETDARSDVFSFGVLLYEMLAGQRPFRGDSPADVMAAILQEDPPRLLDLDVAVSPQLERITERCLQKRPEDRFQSGHDLAIALEAVFGMENAGRTALSGTAARRLRRMARRPGVAALVLIAMGGLATWGLWRSRSGTAAVGEARIRSLVVLPLKNLSGDPAQEYFAEGMQEALTAAVSKIGGLRVISRTSAMHYKGTDKPLLEIAKELRVDAVVEGSVQEQGDRVRVTAQLIDVATDAHLWAETYDRPLRDVLAVHDDVARAIADRVKVALTPEDKRRLTGARQVDPEAYREYLRAISTPGWSSAGAFERAIPHFQAAIAKDPTYAAAYAGLSNAYTGEGAGWGSMSPQEALPRAKAAALRAVELDDQLAEAHFAMAAMKFALEWDWPGAEASFRRGMDLNPRFTLGRIHYTNYLRAMGRFEAAIAMGAETLDIDPLHALAYAQHGLTLWTAGRTDEAIGYSRMAYELGPDKYATLWGLGWTLAWAGHSQEAVLYLRKAEPLAPPKQLGNLMPYGYALAGQCADALRVLERLDQAQREEMIWPRKENSPRANVCAPPPGMGRKERELDGLEKAYASRDALLIHLKTGPRLNHLRGEPRFQELLRKMKLDR